MSLRPGERDSETHPAEMPRLQHAEEDPCWPSGDPPADQAQRLSAETEEDSSIHHADWTVLVLVISKRQEVEVITGNEGLLRKKEKVDFTSVFNFIFF